VPSDSDPPRIGISRCLLGDEVRYDGCHKREDTLVSELDRLVEWVPVCPEMEVGMGVPREPIQLVASLDDVRSESTRVRMVGVLTREDWTARMQQWARARVHTFAALRVSGFVLKARSPSCGLHDVLVHGHGNEAHTARGRGLFAEALVEGLPGLPIEDEEGLRDPEARQRFLDRVFAYRRSTTT
jgi:uncharacterized protein YbbK (DUF523 family)